MLSGEEYSYEVPIKLVMANLPVIISNLLRTVLEGVPDIDVVLSVDETSTMEKALRSDSVDVILLGMEHDHRIESTIELLTLLRQRNRRTRYLVLTEKPTYSQTIALFRAGANGIISADELQPNLLCKCVRCVHNGEVWANNEMLQHLVASLGGSHVRELTDVKGKSLLTSREHEVLQLLAEGLSNSELAGALKLSEHTVKNHLFRIYEKLGVSNRMEAVLYFLTPHRLPGDTSPENATNRGPFEQDRRSFPHSMRQE